MHADSTWQIASPDPSASLGMTWAEGRGIPQEILRPLWMTWIRYAANPHTFENRHSTIGIPIPVALSAPLP